MARGGSRKRRKRRPHSRPEGNGRAPAGAPSHTDPAAAPSHTDTAATASHAESAAASSHGEPTAAPSHGEPTAARPPDEAGGKAVMARGYSRARQRDEEARAKLRPLAPGERPAAVTAGALVALVLGLVNPLLYALGVEVNGNRPAASGVILYSAVLLLVAWGMWRARYWAVLGMQTLLALALVVFGVFLVVEADSVGDVAISLAVLGGAGTLFWFLVKAMARIQMPQRPGSPSR